MKVLDLRCTSGHLFEGWFASEDDFLSQSGRGLIECPLCADRTVVRMPSAPRLNLSGANAAAPDRAPEHATPGAGAEPGRDGAPAADDGAMSPQARQAAVAMQALWMKAVRHAIANTEDVGTRFAQEARRIHHGQSEERAIRGQATPVEREELRDEGIEVHALPMPAAWNDGPLQ